MSNEEPDSAGLKKLAVYLLNETNKYAGCEREGKMSRDILFQKAEAGYKKACMEYPFLKPINKSFKTSLFGKLGNYMGYGGYYNPFTGEAQLNTFMPAFTLPFISVHEMAHQMGFAKESEANFVGYVAAKATSDSTLRYSANLEMLLYVLGNINRADSQWVKQTMKNLHPKGKADLREYKAFVRHYQGWMDDLTTWFYSGFLKLNNQPEGMKSYGGVVFWLYNLEKEKSLH